MVAHICNSRIGRDRHQDVKFKTLSTEEREGQKGRGQCLFLALKEGLVNVFYKENKVGRRQEREGLA